MSLASGVCLQLDRVGRTFEGAVRAVEDVSLEIPAGQFVSLLGPSGCGKTTILRMVASLERIDAGRILVDDQPLGGGAGPGATAFVFQDAHLLPWRNVLGNVELPLELMGEGRTGRRAKAMRAIQDVDLSDAVGRYPAQLSGGMRMRVSLARALVTRPRLLLLDEPFAALDELTRRRLDVQLVDLWARSSMTVLFVTHSILEAVLLSQRVIVFAKRPARVVADVAVELEHAGRGERQTDGRFLQAMQTIEAALRRAGE
jgi:NitT/TauT family transport system ATP-binding protein